MALFLGSILPASRSVPASNTPHRTYQLLIVISTCCALFKRYAYPANAYLSCKKNNPVDIVFILSDDKGTEPGHYQKLTEDFA